MVVVESFLCKRRNRGGGREEEFILLNLQQLSKERICVCVCVCVFGLETLKGVKKKEKKTIKEGERSRRREKGRETHSNSKCV